MSRMIACLALVVAVATMVVAVVGGAENAAAAPALLAGIFPAALVGLFVSLRRPGNVVAWILLVGALAVAVVMLGSVVAELEGDTTLGRWAATVAAPWPVLFLWPLALAFVFPDGPCPRPAGGRSRGRRRSSASGSASC